MMVSVLGICPSARLSTQNPPGPNVTVSVVTPVPAGTYSLALISDSTFHVPRKYSNFLCSGPGFGPSGGACASESAVNPQIRMTPANDRMLILFSFESALTIAGAPLFFYRERSGSKLDLMLLLGCCCTDHQRLCLCRSSCPSTRQILGAFRRGDWHADYLPSIKPKCVAVTATEGPDIIQDTARQPAIS